MSLDERESGGTLAPLAAHAFFQVAQWCRVLQPRSPPGSEGSFVETWHTTACPKAIPPVGVFMFCCFSAKGRKTGVQISRLLRNGWRGMDRDLRPRNFPREDSILCGNRKVTLGTALQATRAHNDPLHTWDQTLIAGAAPFSNHQGCGMSDGTNTQQPMLIP